VLVAGVVFVGTAIDGRIRRKEVSGAKVSVCATNALGIGTAYMVFRLITANFPGITSTLNHPPCWN
jgi:hypothetical protein